MLGCEKSADANDSGGVSLADALWILDDVFDDGPPMAEPDECGGDPTPDDLGCEVFESCL